MQCYLQKAGTQEQTIHLAEQVWQSNDANEKESQHCGLHSATLSRAPLPCWGQNAMRCKAKTNVSLNVLPLPLTPEWVVLGSEQYFVPNGEIWNLAF